MWLSPAKYLSKLPFIVIANLIQENFYSMSLKYN